MKRQELGVAVQGVGSLNGDGNERLTGSFKMKTYSTTRFASMPSPEAPGKLALIVERGGRLYAVGAYPMGGE